MAFPLNNFWTTNQKSREVWFPQKLANIKEKVKSTSKMETTVTVDENSAESDNKPFIDNVMAILPKLAEELQGIGWLDDFLSVLYAIRDGTLDYNIATGIISGHSCIFSVICNVMSIVIVGVVSESLESDLADFIIDDKFLIYTFLFYFYEQFQSERIGILWNLWLHKACAFGSQIPCYDVT